MKQIIIIIFISFVTACGAFEVFDDAIDETVEQTEELGDLLDLDPAYITLDDGTATFYATTEPDLYIRSNRSTITITSGSSLDDVYIEGNNCIITFEHPIKLNSLNFEGSDNVVNVPATSGIVIAVDNGSGNMLIYF